MARATGKGSRRAAGELAGSAAVTPPAPANRIPARKTTGPNRLGQVKTRMSGSSVRSLGGFSEVGRPRRWGIHQTLTPTPEHIVAKDHRQRFACLVIRPTE